MSLIRGEHAPPLMRTRDAGQPSIAGSGPLRGERARAQPLSAYAMAQGYHGDNPDCQYSGLDALQHRSRPECSKCACCLRRELRRL